MSAKITKTRNITITISDVEEGETGYRLISTRAEINVTTEQMRIMLLATAGFSPDEEERKVVRPAYMQLLKALGQID